MIATVRRSRTAPGGAILPGVGGEQTEGAAFSSPGASNCSARAGVQAGSARASCTYAASSKADAETKANFLIAHTKDCLAGWPTGGAAPTFVYQSPDRQVMGGVNVRESSGKFAVERAVFYDVVRNPVVQDDTCATFTTMQKHAADNFASVPVHKLASGTLELDAPVAHATMCYAFPRAAGGSTAGLSCTWVVEDKDPNGPGKEVLARGFYQRMINMPGTCRTAQTTQPGAPLGDGELASTTTSDGREHWSIKLLGPEKGAPWAVMLTLKQK